MPEATTSADNRVGDGPEGEPDDPAFGKGVSNPPHRSASWWPVEPRRALWGILGAQALWLLYLMSGGWYLHADLSNLAEAARNPLSWDYLTKSLGGHFSLVGRLSYWVLHRVAPMDYGVTIGLRIVLQLLATWLLYRLLVRLVGQRPLVLLVVGMYAASPILGPNLTYFTPALGQTIGQVFALAMYLSLARWTVERRLRWALATGVAMLLMVMGDDQMIVLSLTLPILVLTFLDQGSLLTRARRELRGWAGWLLIAAPTGGFVAAFVFGGYGTTSGGTSLPAASAVTLVRDVWLKAVGPLFVGGPLHWTGGPGVYVPFASPSTAVILLGQLMFLCLVVVGVRRVGLVSLWAWAPLIVVAATGILLVGAGRYSAYGSTVPVTWRYSFPIGVPLALGVALALAPIRRAGLPGEDVDTASPSRAAREAAPRLQRYAAFAVSAAVFVASGVSGVLYVQDWWDNPAKSYVATLVASSRATGPSALLYDTPVRGDVISPLEPDHHLSDLLRLMDVPATFDRPGGPPLVATGDGRLVPATFIPVASAAGPRQPSCGTYVHGLGRTVIPLSTTVRGGEWYLQLSLYQAQPSDVMIQVVDADGSTHDPVAGAAQRLPTLAQLSLRLPWMSPKAVVVTSTSPTTSLCLVTTNVGAPFPAVK
jgi:hypothetical protein